MLDYVAAGHGAPVVLLHGFPLNRQMWQPQLEALSQAGYRVICPDLPGFGCSRPATGPGAMTGYADAVLELLDHLEIDQAVIGGMSMGGYVLLDLVDRHPRRCRAAMFLVTRAAADDASGKAKRSLLVEQVEGGQPLVVADSFIQVLFAPQTTAQRPELVRQVYQWMESTPAAGLIAGLVAMRERPDYVARLPGFDLPALVVGAEQDLAIPPEHARVLAEGLPRATLAILPHAGHLANLEQPQLFNQVLLDFLRTL